MLSDVNLHHYLLGHTSSSSGSNNEYMASLSAAFGSREGGVGGPQMQEREIEDRRQMYRSASKLGGAG